MIHFLLTVTLIWLMLNIAVVVLLTTRKPTPRRELPDYLRRAL